MKWGGQGSKRKRGRHTCCQAQGVAEFTLSSCALSYSHRVCMPWKAVMVRTIRIKKGVGHTWEKLGLGRRVLTRWGRRRTDPLSCVFSRSRAHFGVLWVLCMKERGLGRGKEHDVLSKFESSSEGILRPPLACKRHVFLRSCTPFGNWVLCMCVRISLAREGKRVRKKWIDAPVVPCYICKKSRHSGAFWLLRSSQNVLEHLLFFTDVGCFGAASSTLRAPANVSNRDFLTRLPMFKSRLQAGGRGENQKKRGNAAHTCNGECTAFACVIRVGA